MSKLKEIKKLLKEFDKTFNSTHISYDWDGGHAYSCCDHPLYLKMLELCEGAPDDTSKIDERVLTDMVEDHVNEALSEHEDMPPCAIWVNEDGTSQHGGCCGCKYDKEDTILTVAELITAANENNCSIGYLVSKGDYEFPSEIQKMLDADGYVGV
jgi:hypothetical protein